MNREPSLFSFALRSFWVLFGGIWLIVGVPFVLAGAWTVWKETRFWSQSERTRAVVLRKDLHRATSTESTSYSVTYRFTSPAGETISGVTDLDFGDWERLREQDSVDVEYLRGDPHANRIGGSSEWFSALIFMGMGGAFAGVGGVLFFRDLRKISLMRQLWRKGTTTQGTVIAIEETNVSFNRVPRWRVRYEYRDHVGQTHEGCSGYMSPSEAASWQVSDTGVVRYDPRYPERSIWVGKEGL